MCFYIFLKGMFETYNYQEISTPQEEEENELCQKDSEILWQLKKQVIYESLEITNSSKYTSFKINPLEDNFNIAEEKFKTYVNWPEKALFKNERFRTLLYQVTLKNDDARKWANERFQKKYKKVPNLQNWPDLYEYSLVKSAPGEFLKFLYSDEWIKILKDRIDALTDSNWNIDAEQLEIELRAAWFNTIYTQYYEEYPILSNNEIIKFVSYDIEQIVWDINTQYEDNTSDTKRFQLTNKLDELTDKMVNSLEDGKETDKDIILNLIRENIKRRSNIVIEKNKSNWGDFTLKTWNELLDWKLRSYLYMYSKISGIENFDNTWTDNNYDTTLSFVFKDLLKLDDKIEDDGKSKYLEKIRREEEARLERDKQRRKQAIAERNKSLNQKDLTYKWPQFLDTEIETNNKKEPTWAEIIAKAGIQFSEYNTHENGKLSESWEKHMKQTAFRLAWKDFLTDNPDIQELITLERMNTLYDMESNTFRQDMLDRFEARALKWKSAEEITKIMESLQRFPKYYENELKNLSSDATSQMDEINENITTQTAGSVLDNIKNVFSEFAKRSSSESGSNWFKFNENPVKKQWSELLISCNFSGTDITLRYDLKTGELFMNSFFQFSTDPSAITVWNEDPNEKIGNLGTFEDILDEYYAIPEPPEMEDELPLNQPKLNNPSIIHKDKWNHIRRLWIPPKRPSSESPELPDINELFSKQIDLMSDNRIKDSMASTSYKNIAMYKFLETFNILRDWEISTKKFEKSSNIYDTLNFIRESDSEALEYFNSEFMPRIMEYSGLQRWINNMSQNPRANEKSKRLFDDSNQNNEYMKYLREKVGNFNPSQFLWPDTFDGSYQLKFADLIKEKLLDDSKMKLNKSRMEEFIKGLNSWVRAEETERDPDEELKEQLAII